MINETIRNSSIFVESYFTSLFYYQIFNVF